MKFVLAWVLLAFASGGFAQGHQISKVPAKASADLQKLVQQFDAIQAYKFVFAGDTIPRPLPPDRPENPDPAPLPPPQKPPNRPPHGPHPPNCDPDYGGGSPGSCIEAVCGQLSYFECNSRDKLLEITRMCRNVRGDCVRAVCSRVGTFECDQRNELSEVTMICRGMYDTSCIDYVCSRLPRWDCDEVRELRKIADQCR
ncbi:hypothetical protein D3C87_1199670 [compost metagenome]